MKTKEGRQAERESKTEGEGFVYGRCGNGVSHSSAWEPGRTMVEACRYRKDRGCPAAKLRGGLFLQYREKISLFTNWYAYHSPVILLTACRKQVRLRVNKRTGESGEMDKINQEDMKRICLWNSLTRTASIPCLLSIARLMARCLPYFKQRCFLWGCFWPLACCRQGLISWFAGSRLRQ